MKEEMDAIEDN
jgi:hypothetical protein